MRGSDMHHSSTVLCKPCSARQSAPCSLQAARRAGWSCPSTSSCTWPGWLRRRVQQLHSAETWTPGRHPHAQHAAVQDG